MEVENYVVDAYREGDKFSKANLLIRGKMKMSLLAQKVFAVVISRVDQAKYDDKTQTYYIELTSAELKKLTRSTGNSFYKSLDSASKQLAGNVIGVSDPKNEKFSYYSLISNVNYEDCRLRVVLNNTLIPWLKDLKEQYTILNLSLLMKFTLPSTFRLYEILKSYAYTPKGISNPSRTYKKRFLISELRFELGINDINDKKVKNLVDNAKNPDWDEAERICESGSAYLNWTDLRRHVIDPAIKEINEKTDLYVEYEVERGSGKKITAIDFTIVEKDAKTMKEQEDLPLTQDEKNANLDKIGELIFAAFQTSIKTTELITIAGVAEYKPARVEKAIEVYKEKGEISNPVGFLIEAIRKEYEPSKKKAKDKMMTNTYDFEALEKDLISN